MLTIIVEGLGEEYALPVLIEKAQRRQLLPDLPEIQYLVANGKPYVLQQSDDIPAAWKVLCVAKSVQPIAKDSLCYWIMTELFHPIWATMTVT